MDYVRWDNLYEKTEEMLFSVFNNLYFQILIDTEGRIVYINDYFAGFHHKSRHEIIGMKVEDLIPNTKLYYSLYTGQPQYDELYETPDGRKVLFNAMPIKNSNGEVLGVATASSLNSAKQFATLEERIAELEESNIQLNRRLHGITDSIAIFDSIVGESPQIMDLKKVLSKVSNTTMPILMTGESGTGKEVFATAIHNGSDRRDGPFVKINCAAIPRELVESELFGYEPGTFSGAIKGGKAGKFEQANHGTILLDEIEGLPLEAQAKLLRVLQEYEVERIGSVHPIPLDIHVICCSNQDLYEMVRKKEFREDLLYRINVIELNIPPLRERKEDIPLLCSSLLEHINSKHHLKIKGISKNALKYLTTYNWPGNVRELSHTLERAGIMSDGDTLATSDFQFLEKEKKFRESLVETAVPSAQKPVFESKVSENEGLFSMMEEQEIHAIREAIASCAGNKTMAAKKLGISRSLLYQKLNKYDIIT